MTEDKWNKFRRCEKNILPESFFLMKFCGVWQPYNTNLFLKLVYVAYSVFTTITIIMIGLSLLGVIFSSESIKNSAVENSFLLLSFFNSWVKGIILFLRQRKIKSLLNVLIKEQCQPSDDIELKIQRKYDKEIKKITVMYSTTVILTVVCMSLAVISKQGDERVKLLNCWRPYNLRVPLYFWITWIHQFVGYIVIASVHLASDTLVPGFIIQICCQLKFLQHRLNDFPRQIQKIESSLKCGKLKQKVEKSFISKTIKHHNTIYQFANNLKHTFVEMLLIQFLLSVSIICLSVFKISKENVVNYASVVTLYSYVTCMLMQLFLFCWYGNKLMLNSSNLQDTLLETNWLCLESETKKSLIIMMICCSKPILISAGSVIIVNLDSFVTILKTSYSVYNVLKHSV